MNEAIHILEQHKTILLDCLKGFNDKEYPEAFKNRNKKLKEINEAIYLIKQNVR